jgi:hypothetical protein
MRAPAWIWAWTALVWAQTPPVALVRGVLLECDAKAVGEFSIRTDGDRVFRFSFDGKTYVERNQRMVSMQMLRPGDKLEVLSDHVPDSLLRYARTVHVIETPPGPAKAWSSGRYRMPRQEAEPPVRTGNLTFAGVVFRITPERVVLHLRNGREQSLVLRKDTRYVQNGEIVDGRALKPNTRVFIKAGENVYEEVEAYQIIWGQILDPY